MRVPVLAGLALSVVLAGCGRHGRPWPACLHDGGGRIAVATPSALAASPKPFEARRAASVDLPSGAQVTVVESRTDAGAGKVELAFARINSIGGTLPKRFRQPAHVARRGRAVLAWYGKPDRPRESALLDCVSS